MRIVGLTERLSRELRLLWNKSPKESNGLVFGVTSTVKNAWKAACKDAGLDDLRFHDLRHTATTRLIRAGVPATEVMKVTGHTQTKTFL
jgi:integrase